MRKASDMTLEITEPEKSLLLELIESASSHSRLGSRGYSRVQGLASKQAGPPGVAEGQSAEWDGSIASSRASSPCAIPFSLRGGAVE